jgi:hypothetical protein
VLATASMSTCRHCGRRIQKRTYGNGQQTGWLSGPWSDGGGEAACPGSASGHEPARQEGA